MWPYNVQSQYTCRSIVYDSVLVSYTILCTLNIIMYVCVCVCMCIVVGKDKKGTVLWIERLFAWANPKPAH